MKRMLAVLALSVLAGCFHLHYVADRQPGPAPTSEAWHNGFVWGLVEQAPVEVDSICPSGFAKIDSTETFVNGLVHAVTFSIYTPETVTVTCGAGDAGQIPSSPTRPWGK